VGRCGGLVADVRSLGFTPHVAPNTSRPRSAIDGRTARHPGHAVGQRIRKRIEEPFGRIKTIAGGRKLRYPADNATGPGSASPPPPTTSSASPPSTPQPPERDRLPPARRRRPRRRRRRTTLHPPGTDTQAGLFSTLLETRCTRLRDRDSYLRTLTHARQRHEPVCPYLLGQLLHCDLAAYETRGLHWLKHPGFSGGWVLPAVVAAGGCCDGSRRARTRLG
jgi:hypothetical protein